MGGKGDEEVNIFVFFKIRLRFNHIAPSWNQYVRHMKYPLQ